MKAQLVKRQDRFDLYNESDGSKIASTLPNPMGKLSIANCEAIANGYDLDELAGEYANKELIVELTSKAGNFYGFSSSFKEGFQKALEILGDKKFSEKQMYEFADYSWKYSPRTHPEYDENLIKQQTEWDVEIEMEKCGYCEGCNKVGMLHCAHADSCGYPIETERPKLDENGCLILKRK